jgi:AN1-type zinc finger protein 5/6
MPSCEHCKTKKVGIIPFTCKCEYKNLCAKCRLPFDHNCSYDFKKEWKDRLEKVLPVVIADKLNKI